ncbi:MAG: hypothetical protein J6H21_06475 [Firmicutes bacterium]|nr:hypothetical protein [Bacillota bacterium]
MLGYVIVNKNELKEEEFDIYRGYYCGVCKSIGSRLGQVPRLALSYDSVFLAMILSSLEEKEPEIRREHCIIHPIEKNPAVKNDPAVDYAADILLMLAYHNFLDDKNDEHKVRGTVGSAMLRRAYKHLRPKHERVAEDIEKYIQKLSELEKEKCSSLDIMSETFGKLLESVFTGFSKEAEVNRVLGNLGMNLGKWIYVMDALDDFDKDKKSGSYNPLFYRERGREGLEDLLYTYLGNISGAVDLLDIRKNKGIIDNVIWNGLRARTDLLLQGENNGRSI